ncbi:MAG: prepilin peptidase [Saccharofermentanales bacterium]|jgi:prepilin signal peptidase PulO-like enzyme (type II secretory pathway)
MNIFINLFCFLPFLRFTYTDLRWQKVYNKELCLAWLIISGIKITVCTLQQIALNFLGSVGILLILLFTVLITELIWDKYLFGGGDIKLIALSVWAFGFSTILFTIWFACSFAFVFILLTKYFANSKTNSIPFSPFLTAGLLFTLLLQHLFLLSKI